MDFERFRELKGWTLDEAADHLRNPEDPRLVGINGSVVGKHERGLRFPAPWWVARYAEVTEGAVTFEDWMKLQERAPLPRRKRTTRRKLVPV